ncbi:hypothetical protein Agub_g757 [Astrephomene gubernaculifera]|uniref:Uncharacterized protein n=1 Tax=Astrephomene gubernaculifera TaxID=47775 RepID=A0AAD3DGY3_9CHLO|nr:hypothetical protein Agub_g757 [Astrephomene gubernaculifera]
MAKGLCQRRRVKRALEAARGNLHKIANGKALPKALPEAPKPKDTEKLPASLRKLLALKEAAEQQQGGKARTTESGAAPSTASQGKGKRKDGAKDSQSDGDGPSTSGRTGMAAEAAQQQKQQQGHKDGGLKGGNAFTTAQSEEKKLKDRKKEYLKRKQQDKKRKKVPAGQVVVEKELQLRDKVKFGEVVDAPLEVHLKRKHWAEQQERSDNERCKNIFLKQMQQAQQRLEGGGGEADEGQPRRGGKAAGAGQQQKQQQQKKDKKRKAPMDEETEALRQQVIESYRATKKGGGYHNAAVGNATMSSLSQLVGKSGKAAAAATHTLA